MLAEPVFGCCSGRDTSIRDDGVRSCVLRQKARPDPDFAFVLLQGIYQGILAASIAGLLFAYAIHNIGPQRATLMLAMVPGISAVAAVPLLKESLDAVTLAGVVLVMIGAVLGATHQSAK